MERIFSEGFGGYVCEGDMIETEHEGFALAATVHRDDARLPWDDCGHGEVSEWTRRDKAPGELVLCDDRGAKRYYDFAGACRIALRDGWGCEPYVIEGETKRAKAARAARADFEVLRAWCNDEWYWCGIVVTASRNGIELGRASLWGIEANYPKSENAYLRDVADELVDEAVSEARSAIKGLAA